MAKKKTPKSNTPKIDLEKFSLKVCDYKHEAVSKNFEEIKKDIADVTKIIQESRQSFEKT